MKEYTTEELIDILKSERHYDFLKLEAAMNDAQETMNHIREISKRIDELESM